MLDDAGVPVSERDYGTPRKILENIDDISVSQRHILVKLLDGTLMLNTNKVLYENGHPIPGYIPGTFLILEGMTADKLFNHMDRPNLRFFRTKSARNQR